MARDFVVGYPKPQLTGLAPGSAESGPNPVTVAITGTGFLSNSTVLVNGVAQPSTFINSTAMHVTLSSSSAGNRLISVANPTPGGGASNSGTFIFSAPPVSSILLISQTATSAAVGTAVQFTIELRNLNGQVVPGVGVAFSAASGGGSVPSNATSDAQGRIVATLTLGTTPGLNRIALTAGDAMLNVDVTALVGPAAKLKAAATPASFTASSIGSTISVRIEDQYGNLTDSTNAVAFAVTTGTGNLSSPSVNAIAGVASVTLTSTTAGTVTVQGTSGLLAAVAANVTVNPGVASTMNATAGAGQTGAVGQTLGTALKVQLRDASNNVVPGVTVTFSVVAGGGSVSPTSAVTNSSGEAQTTATLGSTIGTQTFRAAAIGLPEVDFGATATPGAPASLAISANQTTVGAGGTVNLTVAVRDQSGNTVTSASNVITMTSDPAVSVTLGSVTGPTNGVATSNFAATAAGTYAVTASSGSLTPAAVNITVTAGAATNLSMFDGNGQTGVRSSTLATALVVRITDAFGNPVSTGATVTFAVGSGGGSVNPGTAQSPNANGQVSAMGTLGNLAGANQFTAVSNPALTGSPVTFNANATNTPPTALVQVSSHNAATVNTQQTFTVQVNDAGSEPVPSVTVNFAKTAGNGSVSASSVVTGADGRASTTMTLGQSAGTNTYTATVSGLTPITLNVTGNAGTATQLIVVSGNTQTGPLGTQLPLPLVVEARDQFSNKVGGLGVTFAVTAGGGASVNPTGAQTTGSDGRAQANATLGGVTAAHEFAATAGSLSASFTATGTLLAANVFKVSGDNPLQIVAPGVSLLTQFQVRVTNAGGIAVPGVTVNWAAASGGGSVSASTSTTDGNGDATISATVGSPAGANTFTATVGGVTPVTFSASAVNLATSPANMTVNIASGTTAVGAYQVTISFNKNLVNLSSANVSGGNGAGFTGSPGVVNIDNAAGTVTINHFQIGNSPAGNFTVANLTFIAIRSGTSPLAASGITVTDTSGNTISSGFLSLSTNSLVID
jgi:adhesin/invasin